MVHRKKESSRQDIPASNAARREERCRSMKTNQQGQESPVQGQNRTGVLSDDLLETVGCTVRTRSSAAQSLWRLIVYTTVRNSVRNRHTGPPCALQNHLSLVDAA